MPPLHMGRTRSRTRVVTTPFFPLPPTGGCDGSSPASTKSMKVPKEDIPARIDSPDAIARHQPDFGDATDYETIAAE